MKDNPREMTKVRHQGHPMSELRVSIAYKPGSLLIPCKEESNSKLCLRGNRKFPHLTLILSNHTTVSYCVHHPKV